MPVATAGAKFRATCPGGCSRPLDWTVETREHAQNVLTKHVREYHPDEPATADPEPATLAPDSGIPDDLDLTAAARCVIDLDHAAALAVWAALTNTTPADARATALALAERDGSVHALVPPF